jgi:S-(hydroxymethyl)glutathione dehydrogenase/alcohol dehydrogenase
MKALVFHRPKKVSFDTVADPQIEIKNNTFLKVTSTAICGSDLHLYNGLLPQIRPTVLGHELMGVVDETGANIKHLKRGDRVVVPFPILRPH